MSLRVERLAPDGGAGSTTSAGVRAALAAAGALGGRYDARALAAELARAVAVVLVARRDGVVAGYLVAWQIDDEAEIHDVFVGEHHRRHGVARALLERVASGVREVTLEVRSDNQAALALYRGAGFSVVGARPRYYADGVDAVLMTRSPA